MDEIMYEGLDNMGQDETNNDLNSLNENGMPNAIQACYVCSAIIFGNAHNIYDKHGMETHLDSLVNRHVEIKLDIVHDMYEVICDGCYINITSCNQFELESAISSITTGQMVLGISDDLSNNNNSVKDNGVIEEAMCNNGNSYLENNTPDIDINILSNDEIVECSQEIECSEVPFDATMSFDMNDDTNNIKGYSGQNKFPPCDNNVFSNGSCNLVQKLNEIIMDTSFPLNFLDDSEPLIDYNTITTEGNHRNEIKNIVVDNQHLGSDKNIVKDVFSHGTDVHDENLVKEEKVTEISSEPNCLGASNFIKCLYCDWKPLYAAEALRHKGDHNFKKANICIICLRLFRHSQNLFAHLKTKHLLLPTPNLYPCTVCNKAYKTSLLLQKHVCYSVLPKEYLICHICDKIFLTKRRFIFHSKFHGENAKPLFCTTCDSLFPNEDLLFDHMEVHTHMYRCLVCDKKFKQESGLEIHMRMHAGKRDFQCECCKKWFLDQRALDMHKVTHKPINPFQCHECGKFFNRYTRLNLHLRVHAANKLTEQFVVVCNACEEVFRDEETAELVHNTVGCLGSFEKRVLKVVYRCEFCARYYTNAQTLQEHRDTSHSTTTPKPFICKVCNDTFSTYSGCAAHKKSHGWYEKEREPEDSPDWFPVMRHFLCDRCDKTCLSWSYLQAHKRSKHPQGAPTYPCPGCSKGYVRSSGLANHLLSCPILNAKTDTITCEFCDHRVVNERALTTHINRSHPNELAYKCTICCERMRSKATLAQHRKKHMPIEDQHKCSACDKLFATLTGLRAHWSRIHKELLTYKCSYCKDKFCNEAEKMTHEGVHEGQKPFVCDDCGKRFRKRATCTKHTKTHYQVGVVEFYHNFMKDIE